MAGIQLGYKDPTHAFRQLVKRDMETLVEFELVSKAVIPSVSGKGWVLEVTENHLSQDQEIYITSRQGNAQSPDTLGYVAKHLFKLTEAHDTFLDR